MGREYINFKWREEREQRKYVRKITCGGFPISSLANTLSTNLFATETAWYTFDTGYQQKDFQRNRKYKLNETHTKERAP